MHGIEHGFGIIGSAFMPISDLFPKAGIAFWDVAHETNSGLLCARSTPPSAKMAMDIAQNGHAVTGVVNAVKTASWTPPPLIPVTPHAAQPPLAQPALLDS